MITRNTIKLFFTNWEKALKLFLAYIVVFGLAVCLFLPTAFAFAGIIKDGSSILSNYATIFSASFGEYLHIAITEIYEIFLNCAQQNLGLAIYGLIVIFVFLPFMISVVKFVICEMLNGYMASKSKTGFFSALIKTLNKSLPYALLKTILNLVFCALVVLSTFALAMIENAYFQTYFLALCIALVLIVLFTLNKILSAYWVSAIIVFGCSVTSGFFRGARILLRDYAKPMCGCVLVYAVFLLITCMAGVYSLIITIPLTAIFLCVFDMTNFFTSQGMRFYINSTTILTPKKLEEVDKLKKVKYII